MLLADLLRFSTSNVANHVLIELNFCAGLRLLVPVKEICNAAYRYILYYCVLPTTQQQSGAKVHMIVIVRCPQTFGHTVYMPVLELLTLEGVHL